MIDLIRLVEASDTTLPCNGPVFRIIRWYCTPPGHVISTSGLPSHVRPRITNVFWRRRIGRRRLKTAKQGIERSLQYYLGRKNIQHTTRFTEFAVDRFKDFGATADKSIEFRGRRSWGGMRSGQGGLSAPDRHSSWNKARARSSAAKCGGTERGPHAGFTGARSC